VFELTALFLKVILIDSPVEFVFVTVKLPLQRTVYNPDSVIKIKTV
jgi:hypothetical protein